MKKSLLALLPVLFVANFAQARVQFSCTANGIPGDVLISDDVEGKAQVSVSGKTIAVEYKDGSALNMGISRYKNADRSVSITLMSRGARWDGDIELNGTSHTMYCDYK